MKQAASAKIPFTKEAYQALQIKYAALKKERLEVMERLKIAREMGDLSENGAYKYAKFELGSIGRQLRELAHLLDTGVVTEKQSNKQTVDFGSTVTIEGQKQSLTFMIVSAHESDISKNKLSMESPLGSELMGKAVGEEIRVNSPSGEKLYTIIEVS